MKLLFIVLSEEDSRRITCELIEREMRVTKISSSGGFLRSGNATLMVGVEDQKVEEILSIIERFSKKRSMTTVSGVRSPECGASPIEISVGGATVFVVDCEKIIRI